MASSYVNDLRLNEMATGDASGTWGTVTNTNLELIGEALGFGTEAITTNADTHTSTVADGATDPVRAMFVKYTGTLDSACTITIAPNTLNRMHFIENGTSGAQNIIISQGSGANVTIPPGDTKAVYLDGAGSGAAVVDAFASLSVVDLKVQDDLTVTDDLIVNGDIDLEGSIDVNGITNLDVVDIDGAVDMASTALVTGVLTANGGAVFNEGGADVDFRVESDTNANMFVVDAGEDIVSIAGGGSHTVGSFKNTLQIEGTTGQTSSMSITRNTAGTSPPYLQFGKTRGASVGSNTIVQSGDTLGIITWSGSDGTNRDTNAAQIQIDVDGTPGENDMPGRMLFKTTADGASAPSERMRIDSSGRVGIATASAANTLHIVGTSSTPSLRLGSTSLTNYWDIGRENATTGDFIFSQSIGGSVSERMRIKAGNLGIGTSSPSHLVDATVASGSASARFGTTHNSGANSGTVIIGNGGSGNAMLRFDYEGSNTDRARIGVTSSGQQLEFYTAGNNERMRIDSSGNVGILNSSPSSYGNATELVVGSHSIDDAGITIATTTGSSARIQFSDNTSDPFVGAIEYAHGTTNAMIFYTDGSAAARFDSSGRLLVGGLTVSNSSAESLQVYKNGTPPLSVGRQQDGTIVQFRVGSVNGAAHGSISISGTTCSYNAFSGSHWSRLADNSKPTILKGTIIETIDEMCNWYQAEFTIPATDKEDEYTMREPIGLPNGKSVGDTITHKYEGTDYTATIVKEGDEKHVKCKISDTADSKRVYGVYMAWDNDDDTVNDMYVTAVGTHVVRINKDVTISAGDLLSSNGDGTAKVQDDDIIRSKTIGKVLTNLKQETYSDGSYTVPCALYCG